jgi:pilus assembly protein Flp/PilA
MGPFVRLLRCRRGATAIEYALIASLISIAAIGAMNGLGDQIDTMFGNVGNALDTAG